MKKLAKKSAEKPKKPGRPTIPERKRRTKRLDDVRFSPEELEQARANARAYGVSWTAFVRERILTR